MPKQPSKHGSGDRNINSVASKDAKVQEKRNRENHRNDDQRDRGDARGTGNQEPSSRGTGVP